MDWQFDIKYRADTADQSDGQQRMATEGKEVVVAAYAVDRQLKHLRPDGCNATLGFALRLLEFLLPIGHCIRCRQCSPVQLPVGQQGQLL